MAVSLLTLSISPLYIGQLILAGGIFHNIMTCRVFRLLRMSQVEVTNDVISTESIPLTVTFVRSFQSQTQSAHALQIGSRHSYVQ